MTRNYSIHCFTITSESERRKKHKTFIINKRRPLNTNNFATLLRTDMSENHHNEESDAESHTTQYGREQSSNGNRIRGLTELRRFRLRQQCRRARYYVNHRDASSEDSSRTATKRSRTSLFVSDVRPSHHLRQILLPPVNTLHPEEDPQAADIPQDVPRYTREKKGEWRAVPSDDNEFPSVDESPSDDFLEFPANWTLCEHCQRTIVCSSKFNEVLSKSYPRPPVILFDRKLWYPKFCKKTETIVVFDQLGEEIDLKKALAAPNSDVFSLRDMFSFLGNGRAIAATVCCEDCRGAYVFEAESGVWGSASLFIGKERRAHHGRHKSGAHIHKTKEDEEVNKRHRGPSNIINSLPEATDA